MKRLSENGHHYFLRSNGMWIVGRETHGWLYTFTSNDEWFIGTYGEYCRKRNLSEWSDDFLSLLGQLLDFVAEHPDEFAQEHFTPHGPIGFTEAKINAVVKLRKNPRVVKQLYDAP